MQSRFGLCCFVIPKQAYRSNSVSQLTSFLYLLEVSGDEYAHNRYYASDNEVQGYLEALSTISSDYGPALSVQMNGYIVHSV